MSASDPSERARLLEAALPRARGLVYEKLQGQLADARSAVAAGSLACADAPPGARLSAVPIVTQVMPLRPPGHGPAAASHTNTLAQPTRNACPQWTPPASSVDAIAAAVASGARVCALTGAGLSAGSGLLTRQQLWRVFEKDAAVAVWRFREEPAGLWRVVQSFVGSGGHEPNAAHAALAALPGLACIVTQNVDGLHQAAAASAAASATLATGSPPSPVPIVEFHGSLDRVRCQDCGWAAPHAAAWYARAAPTPLLAPPLCSECGGALRPDVVLIGEAVRAAHVEAAVAAAARCDVLLVAGAALDVSPAADLPRIAAAAGAAVLEFNTAPQTRVSAPLRSAVCHGPVEETLPRFLAAVQRRWGGSGAGGFRGSPVSLQSAVRSPAPLQTPELVPSVTLADPPFDGFARFRLRDASVLAAAGTGMLSDAGSGGASAAWRAWPGMRGAVRQRFYAAPHGRFPAAELLQADPAFQSQLAALPPAPPWLDSLIAATERAWPPAPGLLLAYAQATEVRAGGVIRAHRDPAFYGDELVTVVCGGVGGEDPAARSLLRLSAQAATGGGAPAALVVELRPGDGYVLARQAHRAASHEIEVPQVVLSHDQQPQHQQRQQPQQRRLSVTLRYFSSGLASTWERGDHSAGANHETRAHC